VKDPIVPRPAEPPALRVATYNVHGCRGIDGRLAPERIGRVVTEIDADAIGLQEVFSGGHLGSLSDQLAVLAETTGLTAVAAPVTRPTSTGYGNALLTRWTVGEVAHCDLTIERREPRGAVEAVLSRDGTAWAVVVTHLGLGRRERLRQIRQLLAWLADRPSLPRVILGDLNEWNRWSAAWQLLARAFHGTPPLWTFPTRRPVFPLDRVLVGAPARLEAAALHRTAISRVASDHLPLVATVRMESRDGARPV
jgi:endonuclease/exonuclease/phosphatase family metal-dependent hydrolase